jgi:uncharacterized protein YfiM (DUF2279 family)
MDVKRTGERKRSAPPYIRDVRASLLCILCGLGAAGVSAPCVAQTDDRWLGPDKPVHAFAAGWTAGAGYAAALELEWEPSDRRLAAIGTGLAASLAKEARDRWTRDQPFSFKDLAADALGIAVVVALTALADR